MIEVGQGWTFQLLSMRHVSYGMEDTFDAVPQWTRDLHIVHTVAGAGVLHLAGVAFAAQPGVVLVPPPFARGRWEKRADMAWEMINLHVGIVTPAGFPLHERNLMPIAFPMADPGSSGAKLADLYRRWSAGSATERLDAAAEAVALAARHVRSIGRDELAAGWQDTEMIRARRIVEARADRFVTTADLAAEVGLGPREFDRRFRACWGLSPKSYWQTCRFGLAQARLASTAAPVGQVAEALGFSDIYYFSRWFRRRSGLSPSDYRQRSRIM